MYNTYIYIYIYYIIMNAINMRDKNGDMHSIFNYYYYLYTAHFTRWYGFIHAHSSATGIYIDVNIWGGSKACKI